MLPAYAIRYQLLEIDTLQKRRKVQQAMFVVKLLRNKVVFHDLLPMLNIRASQRPRRQRTILSARFHRTTYGFNNPMSKIIRTFTLVEDLFELEASLNCFGQLV